MTSPSREDLENAIFACHAVATAGQQRLCAGWYATHGADHPTVRLGVGDGWPPLFSDYTEMAAAHRRTGAAS
jgi:Family of unknown function (DUF6283)